MMPLLPDRPSTDPKADLFGHATFAEQLARSIGSHAGEDGLVLALHGPWGSGKTTVLGYVCHFIETSGAEADDKPIVVQFNPWWFSGREDLARAFMHQLQAVLPTKSEKLKRLGVLLGDFAESLGGLIDLSGWTGGAGSRIGKFLGQLIKKKPKDVPALKAEIGKVLRDARVRVLVIIDDIDRLEESEVRQLFTVIKALADFPFVTYLLAFDREVASQAIERDSGLPGDRYLEKIIQVPFELPPVDKVSLRAALFKRLDEVIKGTPEGLFDSSCWINVYFDGIDSLIRVPRDIVRFTNTLSVTYPAVIGEVNVVDFIAIEAIRVFLPALYEIIRTNPDRFAGHRDDRDADDRQAAKAFNVAWESKVPEDWRTSVHALMVRLFPKLDNTIYGADWLIRWRKDLRVCHPDIFPIYFRLSIPSAAVSRREMIEFIGLLATPTAFKERLLQAKTERRPDGLSKVRALLERLMDHVEMDIPAVEIPAAVSALLDIGDALIDPADQRGMFDFGNASRVSRPVYHLLKRLERSRRSDALEAAIRSGSGLFVQLWLLQSLDEEFAKNATSREPTLVDGVEIERLKATWLERVRALSRESDFIIHPELPRILSAWHLWDGDATAEVRVCCDQMTRTDEGLLRFLAQFLQHTRSQTFGDWAVRVQPRLNPSWLEPYIDIGECARRLSHLNESGNVPEWAVEAASQFLKEYQVLLAGKDPDAFDS